MPAEPEIIIVGSLAYDDIRTPQAVRKNVLGGSVTFACAAASFFAKCGMVAVAGADFSKDSLNKLRKFGIDLQGLQIVPGKTFHWSGIYEKDFNTRRTLCTKLNVFQSFMPELPSAYRQCPFLFLANIAPALQLHVLEQIRKPEFVMADTMDLWINTARATLLKLARKVDLLLLNDSEARHLVQENHLITAARKILRLGPRYVIIKKGEHGSMFISRQAVFLLPAYPLDEVIDPTGAGDSFAGGLIGFLATQKSVTPAAIRQAMMHGTIMASYAVESFSIAKLAAITPAGVRRRTAEFMKMIQA
jgi:sugar/nucleoside kinase (ribokinase family)